MSIKHNRRAARRVSLICIAALAVAACDENGEFALPSAQNAAADDAPLIANAPNQRMTERDVERPDLFEVTDRGLWDGRPSLGGVWVAHPDVQDPERVVIRNNENGREITAALFRRERENPGPLLQISSDAADALEILAGTPTELSVVVVRREEVAVPEVVANPVVASLDAPVSVTAEPLEAAADAVETTQSAAVAPAPEPAAVVVELPSAVAVATPSDADVVDISSVIAPAPVTAPADGPVAQIGVFSVQANANAAVSQINAAGIAAQVTSETMGGNPVWRVTAGPLVDRGVVSDLKALGFVDAFVIAEAE